MIFLLKNLPTYLYIWAMEYIPGPYTTASYWWRSNVLRKSKLAMLMENTATLLQTLEDIERWPASKEAYEIKEYTQRVLDQTLRLLEDEARRMAG